MAASFQQMPAVFREHVPQELLKNSEVAFGPVADKTIGTK
jgi:hypothetical protein